MSKAKTIRAWRDPNYFRSLTPAQRNELETSPAGALDEEAASTKAFASIFSCRGTAICTPCPPQQCY